MSFPADIGIYVISWAVINMIFNFHYRNTIQYIPRNMHTVFALLCFVVVIHWLIFPYPSGLLHWHCGNLTIAPVPAKQPWWIWINTSCEFIMTDCTTTTKQSTTKSCAYFLGYTVISWALINMIFNFHYRNTIIILMLISMLILQIIQLTIMITLTISLEWWWWL